jgi:hypothetical protein
MLNAKRRRRSRRRRGRRRSASCASERKNAVVNKGGSRPIIYTQTNKRINVTAKDIEDYGRLESAVHAIRVENEEVLL